MRALESFDRDAAARVYAQDVRQIEMPKPTGDRRGLSELLSDIKRSKAILQSQRYDVTYVLGSESLVMVEYEWSGVLRVPIGDLEVGSVMQGNCMMTLEFRDGQTVGQRNYDCF